MLIKKVGKDTRRKFLKKAVYITPTLIILGALIRPKNTYADKFGGTPSDPEGW